MDLQIGGVTGTSGTVSIPMKHKMGLVKVTLGTKSVPTTRTYSASGTQAADASGMKYTDSSEKTNVTASSSFDTSCKPYTSDGYWYIVRGSNASNTYTKTFKSITTVNTDWEYPDVSVNQGGYLNITVQNTYIKRLCYKFTALFSCTQTVQSFKLPVIGSCTYECWGARGGNDPASEGGVGGYGGYTKGTASFAKLTQLWIYVGEQGKNNLKSGQPKANAGGWNGGGGSGNNQTRTVGAGGGGATDFRLTKHTDSNGWGGLASLRSRLMVAAGGGGAAKAGNGANGGGLTGDTGINGSNYEQDQYNNTGGGQKSTGSCDYYTNGNMSSEFQAVVNDPNCLTPYGTFGYADPAGEEKWWGGGGGGGWYGGVLGYGRSGSGGSSFISGYEGCKAVNQSTSTSTVTNHKNTGTNLEQSKYDNTYYFTGTSMTAGATNSPGGSNGYARITMVTPVNN